MLKWLKYVAFFPPSALHFHFEKIATYKARMETWRGSSEQPLKKEDSDKATSFRLLQTIYDELGSKLAQSLETTFMNLGEKKIKVG